MKQNKLFLRKMILASLLIAIEIVLERLLVIEAGPSSRYSFAFIARAVAGVTLGPVWAMCTCGLSDVIGSFIKFGEINPLITTVCLLKGLCYGIFFYKKLSGIRIISCVLTVEILVSLLLNSGALSIWYKWEYKATVLIRIPQCVIMIVIQIVVLTVLKQYLFPVLQSQTTQLLRTNDMAKKDISQGEPK